MPRPTSSAISIRSFSLRLLAAAAACALWAAPSFAQPMGKTIVIPVGLPDAKAALASADALEAALLSRRAQLVSMHDARDRFNARSRPPLTASTSDLDVLAREARQALEHVAFGRTAAAQRSVREVMARAERTLESLNRETARARQLLDACLSLVRSALHDNHRDQALEQAMACRRLVPDLAPSEVAHPANVVGVLAEADDLLRRMRVGKLSVSSQPEPSCSVFLNGRHLGTTPFVLDRAASGEYRVQVECDSAPPGRVHVVQLGDEPVSLTVDSSFDRSVVSEPRLLLSYLSEASFRESVTAHATQLGRETRVEDVVLVRAEGGRAELLRLRVGQGRVVARTHIALDDRGAPQSSEQLSGAVTALFEGRMEPGPSLAPTPHVQQSSAAAEVAPTAAEPAPAPAPAAAPLETPPMENKARRRAGFALAGIAGALFSTGLALELRAQSVRDEMPILDDESFSKNQYGSADQLMAASWLGVSAGPVGLAALLLSAEPRTRVPWWSYAVGASGLAVFGVGVYELVSADACAQKGEETCLRVKQTEALGAILMSAAAPLVALPFTQLVRRRRVAEPLAWELRAAPGRASVVFRAQY